MKEYLNRIVQCDCTKFMEELPSNSVDLIFVDPPFNVGIKYDAHNDNMSYEKYCKWSEIWIKEIYRLLKNNGTIYIAIGDEFVAEINVILKRTGFYFRNWII